MSHLFTHLNTETKKKKIRQTFAERCNFLFSAHQTNTVRCNCSFCHLLFPLLLLVLQISNPYLTVNCRLELRNPQLHLLFYFLAAGELFDDTNLIFRNFLLHIDHHRWRILLSTHTLTAIYSFSHD